jgi:hypothetical protein
MSLSRTSTPTTQDARPGGQGCASDAPEPGWWQAAGGRWYPPVTGMTCGKGHLMNEDRAFCSACGAPRAEFAIESASPFDPAAIAAVADGATRSTDPTPATAGPSTDATPSMSSARKRALPRLRRRMPSS